METKTMIKIVVVCEALAINLLLLGFVIWFIRKNPEETVPFWPMIASLIVSLVKAAVQVVL